MFRHVLALAGLFAFAVAAAALEIPPAPATYVNDYANVLPADRRAGLERRLAEFERATSNQVVVAVFKSLESRILEEFTLQLATAWQIGQEKKRNGVLLAVFLNDRTSRIEVGYGLEGALPDAICAQILRNELAPHFKQGDYAGGLDAAVAAIESATRGEYQAEARNEVFTPALAVAGMMAGLGIIFFYLISPLPIYAVLMIAAGLGIEMFHLPEYVWLVVLLAIGALEWIRQKWIVPKIGYTIHSRRSRGSRGGYWSDFGGGGGGWSGGFGGGGGFSGGGGSFGGGGASGRW